MCPVREQIFLQSFFFFRQVVMTPKVGFVRVKLCQIASGQLKSAKGESFLDAYFAINIKDGMKREGEREE